MPSNPDYFLQGRNCIVLLKGETTTVTVSSAMTTGGWPGGQGVMWTAASADDRVVTYSNGLFGGFLIWGSDEPADKYTAMTLNQVVYQEAVLFMGSNLILTTSFEQYTYASRLAGPLVPITYIPNDALFFSLRGLWTNQDELTLSGSPLAPALPSGFVAKLPKAVNGNFLGIQTTL